TLPKVVLPRSIGSVENNQVPCGLRRSPASLRAVAKPGLRTGFLIAPHPGGFSMNTITKESLELLKGALAKPDNGLAKSISTASGLLAYDLQAPAKNLYPFVTPIRNVMPRVGGGTGPATNWRQVNAIIGSGFDAMGWVPEGQRSGQMSYSTSNKSATYVTIGEEDAATYEAISAGVHFDDIQARMTFRLLQKMMLKEEMAI